MRNPQNEPKFTVHGRYEIDSAGVSKLRFLRSLRLDCNNTTRGSSTYGRLSYLEPISELGSVIPNLGMWS